MMCDLTMIFIVSWCLNMATMLFNSNHATLHILILLMIAIFMPQTLVLSVILLHILDCSSILIFFRIQMVSALI